MRWTVEKILKEPGIYANVTYEEYFQWDAINNSVLWKLKTSSPMHVRHYLDFPPASTDALRIGSALHMMVLEPQLFDSRFVVAPKVDRRTKIGKETWAAFEETLNGRQALTLAESANLTQMYDALKRQEAYQYITGRLDEDTELAIVWDDEVTGLRCKAKLDYARRDSYILCDLKTTGDASERGFRSSVEKYGYYQQAAMYTDGWAALTGDQCSFLFIAQEKDAPHCVCAYDTDENTFQAGRNSYREAMKLWKHCVETDTWPGYNDGKVALLTSSPWLLTREGVGSHQVTP